MAQQRGGFVFGWICAFVVMVIARAAFDAPMIVIGVVGFVGYYVVAPGALMLGLKVSEFFIRRSPGGAALLEEHKAEQEAARKTWDDIKRREASGEVSRSERLITVAVRATPSSLAVLDWGSPFSGDSTLRMEPPCASPRSGAGSGIRRPGRT